MNTPTSALCLSLLCWVCLMHYVVLFCAVLCFALLCCAVLRVVLCCVQSSGQCQGLLRATSCYVSSYLVLDLSSRPWRVLHMNEPAIQATGRSCIYVWCVGKCRTYALRTCQQQYVPEEQAIKQKSVAPFPELILGVYRVNFSYMKRCFLGSLVCVC